MPSYRAYVFRSMSLCKVLVLLLLRTLHEIANQTQRDFAQQMDLSSGLLQSVLEPGLLLASYTKYRRPGTRGSIIIPWSKETSKTFCAVMNSSCIRKGTRATQYFQKAFSNLFKFLAASYNYSLLVTSKEPLCKYRFFLNFQNVQTTSGLPIAMKL